MTIFEERYLKILNGELEAPETIKNNAFKYISNLKKSYKSIFNDLSENDKQHRAIKEMKKDYKDMCYALKKYKDNKINV